MTYRLCFLTPSNSTGLECCEIKMGINFGYLSRNPIDKLSNQKARKRLRGSDVLGFHPYRVCGDVDISHIHALFCLEKHEQFDSFLYLWFSGVCQDFLIIKSCISWIIIASVRILTVLDMMSIFILPILLTLFRWTYSYDLIPTWGDRMMNLIAGTGVEPEHITEKTETDFCMTHET